MTRLSQHKFTASVVAIVNNEKGEVLLLDHLLRPASGWGLPGGFMEPGEPPERAVKREIREETGLEVENIRHYLTRTNRRQIEILSRATASGEGMIKSREITQIRWCALDDLPPEMNINQQFLIKKIFEDEV